MRILHLMNVSIVFIISGIAGSVLEYVVLSLMIATHWFTHYPGRNRKEPAWFFLGCTP